MATLSELFDRLWHDYAAITPQALAIHRLLEARGETIHNDHVALRTFDAPAINLDKLAGAFVKLGYEPKGDYQFPQKKLRARHYEHAQADQPRVFISELKTGECSETLQALVGKLVEQVPTEATDRWDFPASGRLWNLTLAEYEALAKESEYAGWVAAFGFRANHFTVDVNRLSTLETLQQLNALLIEHGFELNAAGGTIKGSPSVFLEQSSTLADQVEVTFADAKATIPGCYYEFARRYPTADGELFSGFVAKSADRIFQSTDRR